jgi:flagellar motor switch protein FliN
MDPPASAAPQWRCASQSLVNHGSASASRWRDAPAGENLPRREALKSRSLARRRRALAGIIVLAELEKVDVDIWVVLGTASMPVHQVLRLGRGAVIELEATEDEEVKLFANNMPIASGIVAVNGNRIAVEVKQMLPRAPDIRR